MLGPTVTLFKLLGFDIKVDASWLFLAALVTWSLATGYFPSAHPGFESSVYWAMGLAGAFGLFFSIVFHELSHSVVARWFGMRIRGITLFIFGGVAELEDEPPSAVAEFLVAIAGPIASLFLAWSFNWASTWGSVSEPVSPALAVAGYLGLINLILAVFNMLPAFPLDGGRALRAALWYFRKDMRSATFTAARIGGAFGLGMIFLGLLSVFSGNMIGGFWWGLIGLFLRGAAQGAMRDQDTRQHFEGEPVRRFMVHNPVSVPPDISVQQFVDDYLYNQFHDVYPVVEGSHVLGLVISKQVKNIPQSQWANTVLRTLMDPLSPLNSVTPDTDSMRALSLMHRTGNNRLLVVDNGRLVGIVTMKDLMRLFELKVDMRDR
jgi:Zn-dependent protease